MTITDAQQDMNRAYADGAVGVLVSGLVWLACGLVWGQAGLNAAVLALFLGGMGIFPLSVAMARMLGCPPAERANPLSRLGLECTFALMAGMLVAWALLARAPALAIPAFAVVMGARYAVFRTLYGNALFWGLGGAIAALGTMALIGRALPAGNLALQVAVVELAVGALLFARWRRGGG